MTAKDKKKKVLLATFETIPDTTGSACWFGEELRALSRRYEVDGLSLKNEDLAHIERLWGARLLRVPMTSTGFLDRVKAFQRALNRQLDSEEYVLCHCTSIWEGMVLATRKKEHKYQLVVELGSLPSVDFRVTHPLEAREVETSFSLKQQEERLFAAADRILVPNPLLRDHLLHRGVPASRIDLMPPAIDTSPFDHIPLGGGQAGTLLYLGSLKPWQGIVGLLQALAEMPRQLRFRLQLLSPKEEPWIHEVQGKVQMMGLSRSIEFLEPVPFETLGPLVANAAVCLAPLANHEHNREAAGIPHKALVYMAARRPIVAARQPALQQLLEHDQHAWLYPPGDTTALSGAIQKLLLDRELATRLGNQARLRLEERFGLNAATERLRSLYRQALGEEDSARVVVGETPAMDSPPFAMEPETRPVPAEALPTGPVPTRASAPEPEPAPEPPLYKPADTAPLSAAAFARPRPAETTAATTRSPTEPDTDPSQRAGDEDELVFRSVESEAGSKDRDETSGDDWQVLELADVRLTDRAPLTASDPPTAPLSRERFLLGGPPFQVREDLDGGEVTAQPTKPFGPRDGDESGPKLLSDDDVELLDDGPTLPPGSEPAPASGEPASTPPDANPDSNRRRR